MLFQRPGRLALHAPCAKQQGGGGFKPKGTAFERDSQGQLLAINMTLLVQPLRNLPFIQGLPHGSSRAGISSSGLQWSSLGSDQFSFCCYNQHSHSGDGAWWFTPLLKMRHLGPSHPCWKFWEILQLLGVWIRRWQHYLLHQEKINQDKWNPCETTEAGVCMKVWYTLQSLLPCGFYASPILYRRWALNCTTLLRLKPF